MATMTISGLDEFVEKLVKLGESGKKISSFALYDGAAVVAEAVVKAVEALPEEPDRGAPWHLNPVHSYKVITPEDKAAMAEAVGIAKFTHSGDSVDTAVGFNGYGGHTEEKWPGGVPIPLIARSIESGSSVRSKSPFFRKAVTSSKGAAVAKMAETGEQMIKEIAGE